MATESNPGLLYECEGQAHPLDMVMRDVDLDSLDQSKFLELLDEEKRFFVEDVREMMDQVVNALPSMVASEYRTLISANQNIYEIKTYWDENFRNLPFDEVYQAATAICLIAEYARIVALGRGTTNAALMEQFVSIGLNDTARIGAVQFGDVSFYEFFNRDIDDISSSVGYRFIMDGAAGRCAEELGSIDGLTVCEDYLFIARDAERRASHAVTRTLYADPDVLPSGEKGQGGRVLVTGAKLVDKFVQMRRKVDYVITHPEEEEFAELRETIERYMSDDEIDQMIAIFAMTYQRENEYVRFYREVVRLRDSGLYPEFYSQIAERMEMTNRVYLEQNGLISIDDFRDSVLEKRSDNEGVNDFSDVMKLVTRLSSHLAKKDIHLRGEDIDLNFSQVVSDVHVNFFKNKPKKCAVRLTFRNAGDKELLLDINSAEQRIDWHIIQSVNPEDRGHLAGIVGKILLRVEENAARERMEVVERRIEPLKPLRRNARSGRETIETVPRKEKTRGVKGYSEIQADDSTTNSGAHYVDARQKVLLTDEDLVAEQLGHVHPDHRAQIFRKIEQVNGGGVEIKELRPFRGLYTVHAGRYRIVLRESDNNEPGTQLFELARIELRNDGYRDYKKQRLQAKKRK